MLPRLWPPIHHNRRAVRPRQLPDMRQAAQGVLLLMDKDKRDVFVAIQVAVANGRGLNLTFDEVVMLSMMTPIEEGAYLTLLDRGIDITELSMDEIAKVKP
jgi:hypothetical protein